MSGFLAISIYSDDELQMEQMDELIQETMADEGVRGRVLMSWAMPDTLRIEGIDELPAVAIDDKIVLQGRMPTREEVVGWFGKLVPEHERAPRRRPDRIGWPSSLDEAVTWLIEAMREDEKREVAAAEDADLIAANGFMGGWGQGIRNGYGLWAGNLALLQDCGTEDADEASLVIMRAARDRLKLVMRK